MTSIVVLCVASIALVAFATSGLCDLVLRIGSRRLEARAPAAQGRILLVLALLPAVVATAVVGAALAPSFGWIADHCHIASAPHSHPHICVHHEAIEPTVPLVLLSLFFGLRAIVIVARSVGLAAAARRTRQALRAESSARRDGTSVLPIDEPQAFVIGVVRPALFITRGLLRADNRTHVDAVLAHERAHIARRDPLRRVVAAIAFVFHLPFVARRIERRLARVHEMAADEEAALALGSRSQIARALVHLSRARARLIPPTAVAFACSDVEARVQSLLAGPARRHGPRPTTLVAIVTLGLLVVAGSADGVHHGLEVFLGVFGH